MAARSHATIVRRRAQIAIAMGLAAMLMCTVLHASATGASQCLGELSQVDPPAEPLPLQESDGASFGAAPVALLPALPDSEAGRADISVQNAGAEPTAALVLYWGPATDPGMPCPGPLAIECTGLIRAGGAWRMQHSQVPPEARSAVILSLSTQRLSDLGIPRESEDTLAAHLCATSASSVTGNCAAARALLAAYYNGNEYAGIPLGSARGAPLVATVVAHYAGDTTPGIEVAQSYSAPTVELGAVGRAGADRSYYATLLRGESDGYDSALWIQNPGPEPASFDVWLQSFGDCDLGTNCGSHMVATGESQRLRVADCVGSEWQGSARISSDRPLGIVVETAGRDTRVANEVAAGSVGGGADTLWFGASDRLVGALAYEPARGWDTLVGIRNLSPSADADVTLELRDFAGRTVARRQVDVCAGGSTSARFPPSGTGRRLSPGSLVLTSRATGGGSEAVPIAADVIAQRYGRPSLEEPSEALQYRLRPDANGHESSSEGRGVILVPDLRSDLDWSGTLTELALTNFVEIDGWTDAAIVLYDQNDVVDVFCRRVHSGESVYLDPARLAHLQPGVTASAVVSAVAWHHPVAGTGGSLEVHAPPDLGAVAISRTGTVRGEDVFGDEAAAAAPVSLPLLPHRALPVAHDVCGSGGSQAPIPDRSHAPLPPVAGRLSLPALNQIIEGAWCRASIDITNAGTQPAKALLVTWPSPGRCPPAAPGPAATICSGLLAPGGTWSFSHADLPDDAYSAAVIGLSVKTLAEIGGPTPSDEPVADFLCRTLGSRLQTDGRSYNRFQLAYDSGGTWAGVPMGQAAYSDLRAQVSRLCPDPAESHTPLRSSYPALPSAELGAVSGLSGGYWQAATPIHADYPLRLGGSTTLHLQNAGTSCATVQLEFRRYQDCYRHWSRRMLAIAPGEARSIDAATVVGPGWAGSVVAHSSQPLALVAETRGPGTQASRRAFPGASAFDLNGDGAADGDDLLAVRTALGSVPGDAQWNPRADLTADNRVDESDLALLRANLCAASIPPRPEPRQPNLRDSTQVMLPAIGNAGSAPTEERGCGTWIAVQNLGDEPTKTALITWGPSASNDQEPRGPGAVQCSGLIAPGRSWYYSHVHLTADTQSGALFSFTMKTIDEILPDPPAIDPPWIADLLCETLSFALPGDPEEYRRFKHAFDTGSTYAGFPMDQCAGAPVAVSVIRRCPADITINAEAVDSYLGVGANSYGRLHDGAESYVYYAPRLTYASGFGTSTYLQNAGSEPAVVTASYRATDDCDAGRVGPPVTIEPGESVEYDPYRAGATSWLTHGWQGAVVFESNQPLGVVVEVRGRDGAHAYRAIPSHMDADPRGKPLPESAHTQLFGALSYSPEAGWDLAVHVQNLDPSSTGRVRVSFLDQAGAPLQVLDDFICAGGSQTFWTSVIASDGQGVGSIQVDSQPLTGDRSGSKAPIGGIATLYQYSNRVRSQLISLVAYNLEDRHAASIVPARSGLRDESHSCAPIVAIPALTSNPQVTGSSAELAVANSSPYPGHTRAAIWFYDQNDLVDVQCLDIESRAMNYVDLAGLSRLAPGFRGSAVISALSWEHERVGRDASDEGNCPLLSAVGVWRAASVYGEVVPGDASASAQGVRLGELPSIEAPASPCEPPVTTPKPPTPVPTCTPTPSPTATPDHESIFLPWLDKGS